MKRDARLKCARCRRWMRRRPSAATPLSRARAPHDKLCIDCAPAALDAFRPASQGQISALHAKCNTLARNTELDRDEWKRRTKAAAAQEFGTQIDVSFKDLTYEQASWVLDWLDERTYQAA